MTTNLNAVAGPSKLPATPLVEVESPTQSVDSPPKDGRESGVSKPGLSVDENGEVVKVPAFLNKLFSMVSDTSTDALIYWADSGDSFFVPNHEQFGKELLPRFFKHSNFSSFVRQLNMYGFHKVPHLQSGVLKNEAPSELWEFVNPFFKRNHPELLSKVTRKNNRVGGNPPPTSSGSTGTRQSARQAAGSGSNVVTTPGGHQVHLITDGTTEGEAGQLVGPTGQSLDLSAIASNIAAIRQAQSTLTADLQALKQSNDALWRETLKSKDQHRTHEETMGLIISFLERLFGTEGEGLRGLKEALRRAGISAPASFKRDAPHGDEPADGRKRPKFAALTDGSGDDQPSRRTSSNDSHNPFTALSRTKSSRNNAQTYDDPSWDASAQRFQTLPGDEDSSTAGTTRTNPTPVPEQTLAQATLSPLSDTPDTLRATDMNALAPYNYPSQFNSNANNGPLSPRTTAAAASAYNLDPSILQTTIGSLLQSPAAAQMFLNSLNNSVQGQTINTPNPVPNGQPNFPFPDQHQAQQQQQQQQSFEPDPTLALFSPLPNHDALINHSDNLQQSFQGAADMNQDVDKLQESIDSLVRSMGLEPSQPDTSLQPGHGQIAVPPPSHDSGLNGDGHGFDLSGMGGDGFDSGFDVDQFLTELAKSEKQIQEDVKPST